jgi:hypothetical protein
VGRGLRSTIQGLGIYQGTARTTVSSDLKIYTPKGTSKGIKYATKFNLVNVLDLTGDTALKGFGGKVKTRYIPVKYIPETEVIKVTDIGGYSLRVSKPSSAIIKQKIRTESVLQAFISDKSGRVAITGRKMLNYQTRKIYIPERRITLPEQKIFIGLDKASGQTAIPLIINRSLDKKLFSASPQLSSNAFGLSFNLRPSTRVIPRQIPVSSQIISPSLSITPSLTSQTKTFTSLSPSISPPPPVFAPSLPPPPPPVTPPPTIFGFGVPKGRGWERGKPLFNDLSGSFNPKYTASVTAGVLGIKGEKPPKFIIESGIGIRPIIRGV